jgi:hypothetical protein
MRVDVCYTTDFRFFVCCFCWRPTRFLWFGQVRHFLLFGRHRRHDVRLSLPPFSCFSSFYFASRNYDNRQSKVANDSPDRLLPIGWCLERPYLTCALITYRI